MKKIYVKPEIIFDSFELSQSIAAGCEQIMGNQSQGSCPVHDEEFGITYIAPDGVCDATWPAGNDKICYHAPTDAYNVFSS